MNIDRQHKTECFKGMAPQNHAPEGAVGLLPMGARSHTKDETVLYTHKVIRLHRLELMTANIRNFASAPERSGALSMVLQHHQALESGCGFPHYGSLMSVMQPQMCSPLIKEDLEGLRVTLSPH